MLCHFLSKGTGVPIVFLHGFLGSSEDWRRLLPYFEGRNCLAYDLPGHGEMPWVDINIDDLLSFALPPEPIDLVGYSLGGRLALRYALKNPSRINSLSLLSAHPGLTSPEKREARLHSDRIWAQKILTLPFEQFLQEWYHQPVFSSLHHNLAMQQEILGMRTHKRPKDLARAIVEWSLGRQPSYREELQNFSRPWRVFYGGDDEGFTRLYKDWPNTVCIEGVGHCLHLEAPQQTAAGIAELSALGLCDSLETSRQLYRH